MSTTTTSSDLLAGTPWRLDPDFSAAEFRVGTYWGLTTVHGRFKQLDGGIHPAGRMWLIIDAASLDRGNVRRDRHLRSADFFDCEQYPSITFRSNQVSPGPGGQLRVTGELDAAGCRARLDLELTVEKRGERFAIDAMTTIDQRAIGITNRRFGIRVPATVTVRALLAPDTAGEANPVRSDHASPATTGSKVARQVSGA